MRFALLLLAILPALAQEARDVALVFRTEVTRRLQPPVEEQWLYSTLVPNPPGGSQYIAVIDRSPFVQALFLYWVAPNGAWHFVGASPVSTGRPGRFDYFETPLGLFAHSIDNLDFRAEGTFNENDIRGYGRKGMRVFDLGWVPQSKGWGNRTVIPMRLQMHATDPDALEPRMGEARSKGCIRIAASLNVFLDRHGILDADYVRVAQDGKRPYMMRPDWQPVLTPGRYLAIVETNRLSRPDWSPPPGAKRR